LESLTDMEDAFREEIGKEGRERNMMESLNGAPEP
jgi:hypothetical protein